MRSYILFLLAALQLSAISDTLAQKGVIGGSVMGDGSGLAAATVSLLKASDTSWLRSVITDDEGKFSFKGLAAGSYMVSATSVGFETGVITVAIPEGEEKKCAIALKKLSTSLADVTVTGKKPFMEMSLGKTVINVDGSPAATGANVLDLLRRSPGVSVDMNGTISMIGKEGVLVLIDDRPTYLSADQLADLLKTMPADEVSQLELITQPSAKYDASGNAGIINIKTKKNGNRGLNGSLSYTYGQGIYPFGEGNVLVDYRKKKLNFFLNGSKLDAVGFANWDQDQDFIDPATGRITSHTHVHSYPVEHFGITSLRAGTDYDASDNTKMGFSIKGSYHPNFNHYNISTASTDLTNHDTTSNIIKSRDGFIRKDIAVNAYLEHKFSKKSNLSINLDYLIYGNSATQDIYNTQYDSRMQPMPDPLVLSSSQPAQITVYSLKGDYTTALGDGVKLEVGFKSSLVNTDNDAQFRIFQNNTWMNDTSRSNRFIYKENINALYVSADKGLGEKWEVRGGLRAENTNAGGLQTVRSQEFYRSYISLFPTVYVTYKMDKNNQLEINYGRRIDRPGYRTLNPFRYYSYQSNYWTGNPDVRPEFTNVMELKHSYKNTIITTFSVSNTTDVIGDILVINNAAKEVYSTPENFKETRFVYGSILFNKDVLKWWSLNISGNVRFARYDGFNGNREVIGDGSGYAVNMNNQFDLKKGWKAEGIVYYDSKWRGSVTEVMDATIFMIFGISKKIGEQFTIKAAANDPFNLYKMSIYDDLYNFRSHASYNYASMRYDIGLTWNLGKNKLKPHEVNAPDETQRMNL